MRKRNFYVNGNESLKLLSIIFIIFLCSCTSQPNYNGGNMDQAVKDFDELDNGASIWNEAVDYYHNKNYSAALEKVNKYLEIKNCNKEQAYLMRGQIDHEIGNYTDCISDMSEVITLNSSKSTAFVLRGNSYHSLGNLTAACEDWQRATDLGSEAAKNNMNSFCK